MRFFATILCVMFCHSIFASDGLGLSALERLKTENVVISAASELHHFAANPANLDSAVSPNGELSMMTLIAIVSQHKELSPKTMRRIGDAFAASLKNSDPLMRNVAAFGLGRLGDPHYLPVLQEAQRRAAFENSDVVRNAIHFLEAAQCDASLRQRGE